MDWLIANVEWIFSGVGVALISAIVAAIFTRYYDKKSAPAVAVEQNLKIYDLGQDDQRFEFYQDLAHSIRNAKQEIYRSGRGFYQVKGKQAVYVDKTLEAEKDALRNGVQINRIQTSDHANTQWSEYYARLMQDYPDALHVYQDYSNPPLVNVGVIDPASDHPTVQLLFESQEPTLDKDNHETTTALFIFGRRELARGLRRQFILRIKELRGNRMNVSDVERLGRPNLYFAYGSNISESQMIKRCPSAQMLGVATLYEWQLEFSVYAAHLNGYTANIRPSPGEKVWGVVYAISDRDKRKLDRTEAGGYVARELNVKMRDSQNHLDVYTYVSDNNRETTRHASDYKPQQDYLDTLMLGAQQHGLEELHQQLMGYRS